MTRNGGPQFGACLILAEVDDERQSALNDLKAYIEQPLHNMTKTGKEFVTDCIEKDKPLYNEAKARFQQQLSSLTPKEHAEIEKDVHALRAQRSGAKKEPKPKLLSPDIFWWGGGLPREGVGAKKFGMSLETQGIKLFWRDIPGFGRDIPEAPEKFEKKMFGFNSRPLKD